MALGSNLMRFFMQVKTKGMVKSSGESSEMVDLCQVPFPGVTVECSGVNYSESHRDTAVTSEAP